MSEHDAATPTPSPAPATSDDGSGLAIVDNAAERRYEARIGEDVAGWVDYGRVRDRLVALHTEVLPEFGGRGIASALVRRVLDDVRAAGGTITPRCPFFVAHLQRHPEDRDLVAAPGQPRDA